MKKLAREYGRELIVLRMDMGSERSIDRACAVVRKKAKKLHVLVSNAGVYWTDGLDKVSFRDFRMMFDVNAFGPARLARNLRGLLRASGEGRIVNVSSESGSLANVLGPRPILAYGASKAALNMLARRMSFELMSDGIRVICIHPGWMKTPMGCASGEPPQDPADTARDVFNLAARIDAKMNGGFFLHNGKRFPW
jgi:NAD(P)-dependent dehydrogenase (short-subunit alcohol dehydrogenase family)